MDHARKSRRRSSSTEHRSRKYDSRSYGHSDERGHSMRRDRYRKYSRSRSPHDHYNSVIKKENVKDGLHKSPYQISTNHHHNENGKRRYTHEEEFFDKRRQERELLGIQDCHIWAKSPLREELVIIFITSLFIALGMFLD